jgi:hypothetical protein
MTAIFLSVNAAPASAYPEFKSLLNAQQCPPSQVDLEIVEKQRKSGAFSTGYGYVSRAPA